MMRYILLIWLIPFTHKGLSQNTRNGEWLRCYTDSNQINFYLSQEQRYALSSLNLVNLGASVHHINHFVQIDFKQDHQIFYNHQLKFQYAYAYMGLGLNLSYRQRFMSFKESNFMDQSFHFGMIYQYMNIIGYWQIEKFFSDHFLNIIWLSDDLKQLFSVEVENLDLRTYPFNFRYLYPLDLDWSLELLLEADNGVLGCLLIKSIKGLDYFLGMKYHLNLTYSPIIGLKWGR